MNIKIFTQSVSGRIIETYCGVESRTKGLKLPQKFRKFNSKLCLFLREKIFLNTYTFPRNNANVNFFAFGKLIIFRFLNSPLPAKKLLAMDPGDFIAVLLLCFHLYASAYAGTRDHLRFPAEKLFTE